MLSAQFLANATTGEAPESYGYYNNYPAICGFAVLEAEPSALQPSVFFSGTLDSSPLIQNSVAFDSIIEGRKYLESKGLSDGWVCLICASWC